MLDPWLGGYGERYPSCIPWNLGKIREFRLQTLLRWITQFVDQKLGFRRTITLSAPSPQKF